MPKQKGGFYEGTTNMPRFAAAVSASRRSPARMPLAIRTAASALFSFPGAEKKEPSFMTFYNWIRSCLLMEAASVSLGDDPAFCLLQSAGEGRGVFPPQSRPPGCGSPKLEPAPPGRGSSGPAESREL